MAFGVFRKEINLIDHLNQKEVLKPHLVMILDVGKYQNQVISSYSTQSETESKSSQLSII